MSTKTYITLMGLLLCLLHAGVIRAQSPPPNIQNTDKASDANLRSNLRVNPSTHAVEFEITLAQYPGRGGLAVPVTLNYSSKVWRVAYQSYTASPNGEPSEGFTAVNAWFNGGWTSNIGIPVILHDDDGSRYSQFGIPLPETTSCTTTPCYRIDRMFIRMPDNSVHELRSSDEPYSVSDGFSLPIPVPDDLYAVDGSRLRYQRSTQTLFLADGSRYILNPTTPRYIDRNGNTLTYTADSPSNIQNNFEVGITDTLGRSIPAFRRAFANNTDVVYSLPGFSLPFTFKWRRLDHPGVLTTPQTLNYIAELGCPPGPGQEPVVGGSPALFSSDFSNRIFICNAYEVFNPVLLHQILLPTGQAYTFTYNVYGELEKVVLPTGGYERYEYESLMPLSVTAPIYSQANRGVKKRFVSATGNVANEVLWSYAFTGTFPYGSGTQGVYVLTTTAPDNSLVDRYLHTDSLLGSFGFNVDQGKSGMVYDERQYSAPNGSGVRTLLRRKLIDWVSTGSNSTNQIAQQNARRNARVAKEIAIFLDTGTASALTQTTLHNYDFTHQFSVGVFKTSMAQYDWVPVNQSTAQTALISSFTTPSQPLRTSETTDLLLDTNIAQATRDIYRARHLVGLPTAMRVKNSAGNIVAQSSMQYDEFSLTTVGSVTGWTDPQSPYRGNLTTVGRWLNTTGLYLQTRSTYDQFGNVRTATDAKGNQTQIGYSSNHAYPTTTTTAIPDPSGQYGSSVAFTSSTNYDVTTGLVLSTTDANGKITSMTYNDPLNRLTQVTQPNGGHISYVYSNVPGDLYVRVLTDLDSSRAIETRTYFDGMGRTVRSFLYDGTPSTPWTVIDTYYDTMARKSKVSNAYRVTAPSGIVPTSCSMCTTIAYDTLARVISVTTPDNAQSTMSYGGSTSIILGPTVLATDQAGKARKGVTDALGRLVVVYEDPNGLNYQTTYTYDTLDNLVKVTQGSQQRFFMYDSLNRLIRSRNPEQGTLPSLNLSDAISGNSAWSIGYQYDPNDNLTQKTDPLGIISTYTYDAFNRNTTVNFSNTTINPDVKRFYDGATNGKGRFWLSYSGGDFSTGANVDHTAVDSYDTRGRPLVQRQLFKLNNVWSTTYQTTRTYNLASVVATQTYPSGHSVTYNYDPAGRLGDKDAQNLAFKGNLGDGVMRTYSRGISYASSGELRKEQFGTNTPVYQNRHYNVRRQLCDVRATNDGNNEWGGELGALVNHYSTPSIHCGSGSDNNGNVLMSQTIINGVMFEDRYAYDALNRLTSVSEFLNGSTTSSGSQQYNYDRWGNRNITPSSPALGFNTSFEKEDATNRLYAPGDLALADTSRRIRYDAAGNQVKNTFTGYGTANFDADNHMTAVQDSLGGWSNYTYNADGQRTRRKISNQETWQIYGIDGELVAEYASNAAAASPQKEYGYRSGQLLITAASASAGAPTSGLVGYWKFNENSGTTAADSSASGNTGTLTSGAAWAAGQSGSATNLDGVNDYVQVGAKASLVMSSAASFSAWIYPTGPGSANPDGGTIVNKEGEYEVGRFQDGTIRWAFMNSNPGWNWINTGYVAPLNQWTHVAVVYASGVVKTYINGVLTHTYNGSGSIGDIAPTQNDFRIGGRQGPLQYFQGRLDEVRVYNRALSATEITTLPGTSALINWLVSDHLGTPRMIIDQTGTLANVKRHDYLPFGEELQLNRTGIGYGGGDGVRQQFTAKERDVETNLDFFEARYYSAIQGRFTSVDPGGAGADQGDPRSWNAYAYAGGNPILFSDPDGREYVVCGPNGNDGKCTTVSDEEFWAERKELKKTGNTYTGSGDFFETGQIKNADGEVVATYAQISIDDRVGQQIFAIRGAVDPIPKATAQFFGISLVAGTTGGLVLYALGPSATTTLGLGAAREIGSNIPSYVRRVLDHIRNSNGSPPPGHRGGRTFSNDGRGGGQTLPGTDGNGRPITYREYDVRPYQQGVNRGAERIVRGSDGSAYYTNDHYMTFIKIE